MPVKEQGRGGYPRTGEAAIGRLPACGSRLIVVRLGALLHLDRLPAPLSRAFGGHERLFACAVRRGGGTCFPPPFQGFCTACPGVCKECQNLYNGLHAHKNETEDIPTGISSVYCVLCGFDYLAFSTMALKAWGLLTARSARTLRLISMPALWSPPIS